MRNGIGKRGQIILRWSVGGLPGWLVLPGFLRRWSRFVHINTWPFKSDNLPRRAVVDILLGPELLLEKKLNLPVAARSNLSKTIGLNMRQTLPGGGADFLWCYGKGKRDKSILEIPVYLFKKSALAEIKAMAAIQKVKLRTVAVAEDATALPFWDDRKHVDRPRWFWQTVSVVLLLGLTGLVVWQETNKITTMQNHIANLEKKKTALSSKGVELRTKMDTENTSVAAISRDLEMFQTEFHRLPILLDLTDTLSDETWISELAISGNELHLSGFTGRDVTQVMASIRDLLWVQRVDLDGPVSFDSISRRNRFDLSIILRSNFGNAL